MRKGTVVVTDQSFEIEHPESMQNQKFDTIEEALHEVKFRIVPSDSVLEEVEFFRALSGIVADLEYDHKIAAIKRVRELSGMGLKESKDLIDRMIGVGAKIEANRQKTWAETNSTKPDLW